MSLIKSICSNSTNLRQSVKSGTSPGYAPVIQFSAEHHPGSISCSTIQKGQRLTEFEDLSNFDQAGAGWIPTQSFD